MSTQNIYSIIPLLQEKTNTQLKDAFPLVEHYAVEVFGRPSTDLTLLKYLSDIPQTTLAHICQLGEQLGFVLIPFGYLDPRAYAEESDSVRRSIRTFMDFLAPRFHVYVLCPLIYYSLARHIDGNEDLRIIAPTEYAQVFQTLEICIPIFRGIKKDIEELRRKLEMNLRAQQERERMRILDPLMVAIPHTSQFNPDVRVLIGPTWGPEFDPATIGELKWDVAPRQRELIERSLNHLLETGARHPIVQPAVHAIGERLTVDQGLLKEVTRRHSEAVRMAVERFVQGDLSVLNPAPLNGVSYSLEEVTRIGAVVKLAISYIEKYHHRQRL